MRSYKTRGFVIRRVNFGEADRIITLLTPDLGKVVVIAKGVRLTKSRKRGSLEIFSNVKFQAVMSHGLDVITEVETINDFTAVRKDLRKVSVGYYMNEVVDRLLAEGESDASLYELFSSYLARLSVARRGFRELRINFAKEMLIKTGHWPSSKQIKNVDKVVEDIVSRELFSRRVGKKILS